ncbi:MAG: AAA family ATPase [Pseudomonadales bacterium]|nr:AAA family ATPase [Pseudomonadales bacterium]MBH2076216.1 AAA family ATPase [Pseudomonadales bacterium]
MSLISPEDLKSLRHVLGLTAEQAAATIGVKERTWQSYETSLEQPSHRTIKMSSLQLFCERRGVPYPPVSNDGRLLVNSCKVMSITTLKGGVGKSPITVNVATELAARGKRVAIISNDIVYKCFVKEEAKLYGEFDPKGRSVHYFNAEDVLLYSAEVHDLERELSEKLSEDSTERPDVTEVKNGYLIAEIEKKRNAPYSMVNITADYDYILLDLNKDLYKTLLLSNIIAVVLNNDCLMSIWAAETFHEEITKLNGGEPVLQMYSLLTNHAPGGDGSEYLEYDDEDDEIAAEARKEVIDTYKRQSKVYASARKLKIPMLRTFLTKAHAMETEKYNRGRGFWDRYGYFDSLIEISPNSLASDEIRRLTDELLDCISKEYSAVPRSYA